jgi:hypothetical protein
MWERGLKRKAGQMRILNVRLGFATNSSSTHSVVILGEKSKRPVSRDVGDDGYGWERFVLVSRNEKWRYFATQVKSALADVIGCDYAVVVAKNLCHFDPGDYVDHQSCMNFPVKFEYGCDLIRCTRGGGLAGIPVPRNMKLDDEFIGEFLESVSRNERLIVVGGNDNGDEDNADGLAGKRRLVSGLLTPPMAGGRYDTEEYYERRDVPVVARKDKVYGYWTIFSPFNGAKLRLSLNDFTDKAECSSAPELVDMKITDRCDKGCAFCYQDSRENGSHADVDYVRKCLYVLGELKCFEVAFGGGEPTRHPRFGDCLSMAVANNMVPNFTTNDLDWLWSEQAESILGGIGSFGYSGASYELVHQVDKRFGESTVIAGRRPWFSECAPVKKSDLCMRKAALNVVMGTLTKEQFDSALYGAHVAKMRVVLLGWKPAGRAATMQPIPHPWMAGVIERLRKENHCPDIGVDTVLAADRRLMKRLGVNPALYTTHEGRFSCYIDAVKRKIGPSSYCDKAKMLDLKNPDEIGDLYKKIVQREMGKKDHA